MKAVILALLLVGCAPSIHYSPALVECIGKVDYAKAPQAVKDSMATQCVRAAK